MNRYGALDGARGYLGELEMAAGIALGGAASLSEAAWCNCGFTEVLLSPEGGLEMLGHCVAVGIGNRSIEWV